MEVLSDFDSASETENNLIEKDADDTSTGFEFIITGDHWVSSSSTNENIIAHTDSSSDLSKNDKVGCGASSEKESGQQIYLNSWLGRNH